MRKADSQQIDRFAENLRLLCSYMKSVSHVCRHLNINRQQFARYLNGETLPSSHNVRKICDFFGVDEDEAFLPPERFRQLVSANPRSKRKRVTRTVDALELPFSVGMAAGLHYVGYYYRYLRSIEYPGVIFRTAVQIFVDEDRLRTKAIERVKPEHGVRRRFEKYKYEGVFMFLADRIFIVETDSLLHNSITETILYPTHKHPKTLLYGEAFGISSGVSRQPYMSPIVYEYVGTQLNLRELLSKCGVFEEDSPSLDERIRAYVLRRERK